MTPPLLTPPKPPLTIPATPLTPSTFHPFGTAISTPLPATLNQPPTTTSALTSLTNKPTTSTPDLLPAPILANQSTALKYSPISKFENNYAQSPSARRVGVGAGEPRMSMFSCFPRTLRGGRGAAGKRKGVGGGGGLFDVRILERHPYTTQTFVPLGVAAQNTSTATATATQPIYLVIVAPTLHGQTARATIINSQGIKEMVDIRDPPDLRNLKAFVAHGGQAVTYGVGTWHAPMVVVGRRRVDFVVVQFVNGVEGDDCQEVGVGEGEGGVVVEVEVEGDGDGREEEEYEDEVAKL
ncbi:hypothetical protein FQN50_003180 [Emmonsiellopsis sp. PD_5]|nr:hypothetical protein FQN50_003180 [Emmonsiellopsis sp. PD_5]